MPRAKLIQGSPDEIEAAYYDALARADLEALGAPRLVGHAAIRATWEEILARGGLHILPRQLHASHTMTTAIHSVIEDIHHPDSTQADVHVIATNVYMKTAQGWRIVAHHASIAPGPAPSEPLAETMLH
jgi:ketosteroid isomerase-like protein